MKTFSIFFSLVFFNCITLLLVRAQEGKQEEFLVFLLAGQSNMEGQGVVDMDHPKNYNGGKGTLLRVMKNSTEPKRYA